MGGVLGGQELIRQSELQSVSSDVGRYSVAMNSFRMKYNALPGDLSNATTYWGAASGGCPAGGRSGTQTCDGNGDGVIYPYTSYENFLVWQHLSNAGLVPGIYTGVPGGLNWTVAVLGDHRVGQNIPAARLKQVGFGAASLGAVSGGQGWIFDGSYGNVFFVGREIICCENQGAAFTPAEMQGIDKKLDDGKAGMGKIVSRPSTTCNGQSNGASPQSAAYVVTDATEQCAFIASKAY